MPIEKQILDKNIYEHYPEHEIHKLNTKNLFFINFKLDNGQEINSYNQLQTLFGNDTINNNGNYLNKIFLKNSQDEYKYLKELMYNITIPQNIYNNIIIPENILNTNKKLEKFTLNLSKKIQNKTTKKNKHSKNIPTKNTPTKNTPTKNIPDKKNFNG